MDASKIVYYDTFAAGRLWKAPTYAPIPGKDKIYDAAELQLDGWSSYLRMLVYLEQDRSI